MEERRGRKGRGGGGGDREERGWETKKVVVEVLDEMDRREAEKVMEEEEDN